MQMARGYIHPSPLSKIPSGPYILICKRFCSRDFTQVHYFSFPFWNNQNLIKTAAANSLPIFIAQLKEIYDFQLIM